MKAVQNSTSKIQGDGLHMGRPGNPPTGVISKFRKSTQQPLRQSSGIPRPRSLQKSGIRTLIGSTGIAKTKNRLPVSNTEKAQKRLSKPTCKADIVFEEDPRALATILNNEGVAAGVPGQCKGLCEGRSSMVKSNTLLLPDGRPSLCRRVPIKKNSLVEGHHSVLTPKPKLLSEEKDVVFEEDPQALASILNNEGITARVLKQENCLEGRPSMVKNNTLLLPDGRPSLCRRVPIRRGSQIEGRPSVPGARRVLPSGQKGSSRKSATGQRSSIMQVPKGTSRNSLYSVVQGRYSNSSVLAGRQSLPIGFNKSNDESRRKQVNENEREAILKSPAQRIVSREVRISASPALRVAKLVHRTPRPLRVKNKDGQHGVKWADENSPCIEDKLAVHLFQESPTLKSAQSYNANKPIKAPVSILKSRKPAKWNSSTPPGKKKEKSDLFSEEEECTIEIIYPQVLNEKRNSDLKEPTLKKPEYTSHNSEFDHSTKRRSSPAVHARKISEVFPRVNLEQSPVLNRFNRIEVKAENGKAEAIEKPLVEVDEVLKIMNSHLNNVKRRSVQSEFGNVIKYISETLKGQSLPQDIIEEDEEKENFYNIDKVAKKIDIQVTSTQILPGRSESNDKDSTRNSSELNTSSIPLTPGTLKDIRENCDEETNKSLDEIAEETERINKELEQLKIRKEQLNAFQEKVKNLPAKSIKKPEAKRSLPQAKVSEKFPSFSFQSPETQMKPRRSLKEEQLNSSWDKLLKSDMNASLSPENDLTDIKSRSMELTNMTSLFRSLKSENFVATQSPQISALYLEKPSKNCAEVKEMLHKTIENKSVIPSFSINMQSVDKNKQKNELFPTSAHQENGVKFLTSCGSNSFIIESKENYKPSFYNNEALSSDADGTALQLARLDFSQLISKRTTPFSQLSPSFGNANDVDSKTLPNFNCNKSGVNELNTDSALFKSKEPLSTLPLSLGTPESSLSTFSLTPVTSVTSNQATTSSPGQLSPAETLCTTSTRSLQEQKLSTSLNSQVCSPIKVQSCNQAASRPLPLFAAPAPLHPPPPKTPAAFRALKMRMTSSLMRPSPLQEKANCAKQPFAQALLDEEVSLLTCRVVRASSLLNVGQDPVAQSLSVGDASHFVPIPKTPSTPRRNRRSSFSESAFSKYLRT